MKVIDKSLGGDFIPL